jgi:predicted nuclease of predicted toxin-antitoxin system
LKFLVDNQLPAALVKFLVKRGVECQHVLDVGLAQSKDSEIWDFVQQHQMVLISKDADFLHLATKPDSTGQLIWIRLGNCRTQALLDTMQKGWSHIRACIKADDRVIEVR